LKKIGIDSKLAEDEDGNEAKKWTIF
jgi:hypothetical protein